MVYDKNHFSSASWTVLWKINYNCPIRLPSWPREIKNSEFQIDKNAFFSKKKIIEMKNSIFGNFFSYLIEKIW